MPATSSTRAESRDYIWARWRKKISQFPNTPGCAPTNGRVIRFNGCLKAFDCVITKDFRTAPGFSILRRTSNDLEEQCFEKYGLESFSARWAVHLLQQL